MAELHRDTFMSGQYFLAVAGMAAMRRILSRPSEGLPRLDDMRAVLDAFDEFPNNIEIEVVEHDVTSGYTTWAPVYDGPNPAVEVEQPIVHDMIRELPAGRALDAACGTGRHAGFMAGLGHTTVGIDATAGMLDVARSNHPEVDFRSGRLDALPLDDASVDLVTCSLALCHVPDLASAVAELARVVAPGGSIILSDPHPTSVQFGGVAGFRDLDADPMAGFTMPFVANLHHPIHAYLDAARRVGLEVVECHEPTFPLSGLEANPAYAVVPDAVRQAFEGLPFLVIWRFRRPG